MIQFDAFWYLDLLTTQFCRLGVKSSISLVLLHFNLNGFLVPTLPLQFHPSGSTPDMSIITKAGPKRKIRGTGNRTKAWRKIQRHWGVLINVYHTACADSEALATTRMAADSQNGSSESLATKTEGSFDRRKPTKTSNKKSVQTPTWPYHSLRSKAFLKLFFWSNHNNLCIWLQTSKTKGNTCSYEMFMTSSRTSNASPSLQLPDLCNSYDKEGCKQASKLLVSTDFDNFFELMKQILSICQCLCIHIHVYIYTYDIYRYMCVCVNIYITHT